MKEFESTIGRQHYFCPVCANLAENNIGITSRMESEFKHVEEFYCYCDKHGLFVITRHQNTSV